MFTVVLSPEQKPEKMIGRVISGISFDNVLGKKVGVSGRGVWHHGRCFTLRHSIVRVMPGVLASSRLPAQSPAASGIPELTHAGPARQARDCAQKHSNPRAVANTREVGVSRVVLCEAADSSVPARKQTIRHFTDLSLTDIVEPAPPATAIPSYTDAVNNGLAADYCEGSAVGKACGDFYSYSME